MENNIIAIVGNTSASVIGFRYSLVQELIAKNNQVYIFVSEFSASDLGIIESWGAIPITYRLSRGGLNPFADILSTYELVKYFKQIQPDLVLSYFVKPVIYGTLAAKIAHISNMVGMLEGLGYCFTEQPKGLPLKIKIIKYIQILLYKVSLPLLDKIIFLNVDDYRDLVIKYNIKIKRVEILGGIGVDLKDYFYHKVEYGRKIRFLFIGRLLKEKGIHEFIEAAQLVKAKYPDTIFTVLGRIDHLNPGALLKQQLDSYIESGLIEYVGHVSDVREWIIKSHVFVLPSYREGVPRSTQEAMAIGRPVLTTDVPGCRETVIDGVNGFLVPRWNVEILVEKMIFLISYPEKIEAMGICSRKIAEEKFNSQKINDRMLKILFDK